MQKEIKKSVCFEVSACSLVECYKTLREAKVGYEKMKAEFKDTEVEIRKVTKIEEIIY